MTQLHALRQNLQMFREVCEQTLQHEGPSPKGLRGVADLKDLEAVFAGQSPFRGELLKPLSAFSNLLVSGRLPREFSHLNLGDACVALGEVLQSEQPGRWRFDPDLTERTAARLELNQMGKGLDRLQRQNQRGWQTHASENIRFVLSALERVSSAGTAVIVGAARAYDLPLDQIAQRFDRVIVVDVCEEAEVHSSAARVISDPVALGRVSVERFDLTGSYNQFVAEVDAIVSRAGNESDAERDLDAFASGYDVPQSAVRLCRAEIQPDFAVSSMVLTQLGVPFKSFVARAFQRRGFRAERVRKGVLEESLSALACRVEQHHIAALLRIPKIAVLTSEVSESAVTLGPQGQLTVVGPPRTQLSVENLCDRIPSHVKPLAESAWTWLRIVPQRPGAPGAVMNVEGLVLERDTEPTSSE